MAALPAGSELTAASQGDLTGENAIDGERSWCAPHAFFALLIAGNFLDLELFRIVNFGNICSMPADSRTPFGFLRFRKRVVSLDIS
jgi:hypothetical protein